MTRSIRFKQFLRPSGRGKDIWLAEGPQVPFDIFDLADELIANGCTFEAEVLTTGQVSLECIRIDAQGEIETLADAVCDNGPPVIDAVERIVREAHALVTA